MGCNHKNSGHKSNENRENLIVKNHNHEFLSSTDYEKDDDGVEHIHLLKGTTGHGDDNNHVHDYFFTTLIEDPSNIPEDRKC